MKEMKDFIEEKYDYPTAEVEAAVRHSKGVVGKALDFLKDKESFKAREGFVNILEEALVGNGSEALLLASAVVEDKEGAERFLEFSLIWFRDLLVYRESQGAHERLIINIDSLDRLTKHNTVLTEAKLNSIIDIIKNTARYVKQNVGIKNSVDGMLLNIVEVCLYNG
jgi:DNA polymerase III subunit delta'